MKEITNFIIEKLKINKDSKIKKDKISLDSFVSFFENNNNNSFGNPIKTTNNIELGKCYLIEHITEDKFKGVVFPFYIDDTNNTWDGIYLYLAVRTLYYDEYTKDSNECLLTYNDGDLKNNKLHVRHLIGKNEIKQVDENISLEEMLSIIKELFEKSKKTKQEDFDFDKLIKEYI